MRTVIIIATIIITENYAAFNNSEVLQQFWLFLTLEKMKGFIYVECHSIIYLENFKFNVSITISSLYKQRLKNRIGSMVFFNLQKSLQIHQ